MRKSNTELKINVNNIRNICIAVIIIVLGVCFWLVFSQWKEYRENLETITILEQRMRSTEKNLQSLKTVIALYNNEMADFEDKLFKKSDVPLFMRWLSLLGDEYDVGVVDIRELETSQVPKEKKDPSGNRVPRGPKSMDAEKKGYTLIQNKLAVQVTGQFENLLGFINAVEGYKKLLSISDLEIKRKAYPLLKCDFDLRVYILGDKEDIKDSE